MKKLQDKPKPIINETKKNKIKIATYRGEDTSYIVNKSAVHHGAYIVVHIACHVGNKLLMYVIKDDSAMLPKQCAA